ncbi:MAG TPA: selenium-dependent molybdenum cofactor biosynthesis protein YqeB [Anaerolineales bacterium]|nr:selenium-dependent molybdenum cofactor biosynthesis protein YqeB [Anaerolineales bacterium]
MPALILLRGGGDLASGVALRLHRAGLNVAITELPQPLAVRRAVSFADAIYEKQVTIEEITGRVVSEPADTLKILNVLSKRQIPILIDPDCIAAKTLSPLAIVDGRMLKRPPEALMHRALLYIGLGPGFTAPLNCHAVIETQRGHMLGRVIWEGTTLHDTSTPEGDPRRVLRAPQDGTIINHKEIGEHCEADELIAEMDNGAPIRSPFPGVIRGMIHPGFRVTRGTKIGDIDPRDDARFCKLVSEKALAVGGGVMEALLTRAEVRSRLWI